MALMKTALLAGANYGESAADCKLPRSRCAALHSLGTRLDLPRRLLLLFYHAQYHRVWRLRSGYQPRRLGVTGEAGSVRSVSTGRVGAHSNVFRLDAGAGEEFLS